MGLRNRVTSNTRLPLAPLLPRDLHSVRSVVRVEEREFPTQFLLRSKARTWILVGATRTRKSWAHECGAFNISVRNEKMGVQCAPGFNMLQEIILWPAQIDINSYF